MGSKYTSQAASGYAASPPSDDGATTEANKIKFSTIRAKLTDVLKTFAEGINTALVTALDHSARSVTASDTAAASDNERTIEVKTATVNITLSDAATMAAGYIVSVANQSSGNITVSLATATDTIDMVTNTTQTIAAYETRRYIVNAASNGYISVSNFYSIYAAARVVPYGQGILINGKISTSVASNALTISVKTASGNDPTPSIPVFALFRKSTLTDSGFDIVPITSALSVVVSSGSTLGHASAIAQHIFVYLINNSGTAELAVSNLPPDYPGTFAQSRLISTTAEGGAGAADSASGIYSTTARSNVPWVCVAKLKSTQATAGTWASAMTQVDQAPFVIPTCQFSVTRSGALAMGLGAWTKIQFNQEEYDSDSTWDATTNHRHQPNVAGVYTYCLSAGVTAINAGKQYAAALYGNNVLMSVDTAHSSVVSSVHGNVTLRVMMNGTSDFVDGRFFNGDASDQSLDTGGYTRMSGGRVTNGGNT